MRITGLRYTPVAVPYRVDECWAFGRRAGQISILVEVDTDEGLTGLGEAAAYPSADVVLAVLRGQEELVVGEDDPELIEQPVSGRCLPEMAYVRGRVDTPLLANEASWTRHDQLALIRAGAADAISADNQMDGGLLNLKRSAGIAEAAGIPVVKHSLGELGVALAATVHVIAATPTFRYANQGYAALLTDDVCVPPTATMESTADGHVPVPAAPGLGVELDRDRVERYHDRYHRDRSSFSFHDPAALAASPTLPKL